MSKKKTELDEEEYMQKKCSLLSNIFDCMGAKQNGGR